MSVFVVLQPPYSPESAEGTPKVPLVPFAGAPDKSCPGAPKKGKAPSNYYDVSASLSAGHSALQLHTQIMSMFWCQGSNLMHLAVTARQWQQT